MRKALEIVGLCALALLAWITARALYGPAHLPEQIPTHFGINGNPDAWGSSRMLLVLPVVAVAIYLLMSVVSRYPSAFNFPVRVTPANRGRLEAIALDMIAWLKAELACLFAGLQVFVVRAAVHPERGFPAALMPVALVAIFATIGWHAAMIFRAARRPAAL